MRNCVIYMTVITFHIAIVFPIKYEEGHYETPTHVMMDDEAESGTETEVEELSSGQLRLTRSSTPRLLIRNEYRLNPSELSRQNIECDDFIKYAFNCTETAGTMYGSSRKAPPMADKLRDWCNALIHLTNCASDWNTECKDVADNHFDHDSLDGHIHVVDYVCLDKNFTGRYKQAGPCIEDTTFQWEFCYSQFKDQIDELKNSTLSWTHYQTHFRLCCARAAFRACTLEFLFTKSSCTRAQAVTMQRFSVIISEGDVHQDCDKNLKYAHCPGGDPHIKAENLLKIKGIVQNVPETRSFGHRSRLFSVRLPVYLYCSIMFLFIFMC